MRKLKEKGITLIALVITIILLLILAGVTLKIIIDNNFIDKTQTAVDKYSKAQARENLEMVLLNYKIGQLTGEEKTLQEYLEEAKITVSNKEGENYTVEIKGYQFKINEKTLEIEEINSETPKPIDPEKTKYTITTKHYLENANDENYTYQGEEKDTTSSVSYGTNINLTDKQITIENAKYAKGSLEEKGAEIQSTTITGNTIIHLYYNRDRYNLALNKNDNIETVTAKATQTGVASSDGKYKVGQNVTIQAETKKIANYDITWTGWTGTLKNGNNPYTFPMPANDVELTANADKIQNNQDPVLNTVSVADRGTNFIKFKANATDADNDNLTYKVYLKTTNGSYPTTPNATSSGTQGTDAVLNVNTGLSEYTIYNYKVVVTDEKTTNEISKTGTTGTGCSGRSATKTCINMQQRNVWIECQNVKYVYRCSGYKLKTSSSYPLKERLYCGKCGEKTYWGLMLCTICDGKSDSTWGSDDPTTWYKFNFYCNNDECENSFYKNVKHKSYYCPTHNVYEATVHGTNKTEFYCSTHNVSSTTQNSHTYTDNCEHGNSSLHFPN